MVGIVLKGDCVKMKLLHFVLGMKILGWTLFAKWLMNQCVPWSFARVSSRQVCNLTVSVAKRSVIGWHRVSMNHASASWRMFKILDTLHPTATVLDISQPGFSI